MLIYNGPCVPARPPGTSPGSDPILIYEAAAAAASAVSSLHPAPRHREETAAPSDVHRDRLAPRPWRKGASPSPITITDVLIAGSIWSTARVKALDGHTENRWLTGEKRAAGPRLVLDFRPTK